MFFVAMTLEEDRISSFISITCRLQLDYNIKSHKNKNTSEFQKDTGKTGFCLVDIQCSIRLTVSFDTHCMFQENLMLIIFLSNMQKKPNDLHCCRRAKCISH